MSTECNQFVFWISSPNATEIRAKSYLDITFKEFSHVTLQLNGLFNKLLNPTKQGWLEPFLARSGFGRLRPLF